MSEVAIKVKDCQRKVEQCKSNVIEEFNDLLKENMIKKSNEKSKELTKSPRSYERRFESQLQVRELYFDDQ